MKKIKIILIAFILAFTSCKKGDEPTPTTNAPKYYSDSLRLNLTVHLQMISPLYIRDRYIGRDSIFHLIQYIGKNEGQLVFKHKLDPNNPNQITSSDIQNPNTDYVNGQPIEFIFSGSHGFIHEYIYYDNTTYNIEVYN